MEELTDRRMAEMIRDGELPSPQRFGDFWLFDLRVTGTGVAYRDSRNEFSIRDPKVWLTQEQVERCNGLPVTFGHPGRAGLNTQEFRERSIGSVVLPYMRGDEIRGVAKIFDDDAALLMRSTHRSTSPGVMTPEGSEPVELPDGSKVLDEDVPLILDHLAICEAGVWDKGGPPMGVRLDAADPKKEGERKYGDVKFADPEHDKYPIDTDEHIRAAWNYIHKGKDADKYSPDDLAAIKRRIVAAWKDKIDPKGPPEAAKREDATMADESEDMKGRYEAACAERDDLRKKLDAMTKDRKDAESEEERAKKTAEEDKERGDAEETEEEADKKAEAEGKAEAKQDAKADPSDDRKDAGAPKENVEATEKEISDRRLHDARDIKALKSQIADLTAKISGLQRQPTIEDRNQIASAFHRADSLYQMLGEVTPQSMPGEQPIAYRVRLASGLRKYSDKFKGYALRDSIDPASFDLIEERIYNDAREHARSPAEPASAGLREVRTTEHGKTYSRFYGDSRAAWAPFMPATRTLLTRFNPDPNRRA